MMVGVGATIVLVVAVATVLAVRTGGRGRAQTAPTSTTTVADVAVSATVTEPTVRPTSTSVPVVGGVKLLPADMSKPVIGPVDYYQADTSKVILAGSVPTVAVAEAYYKKAVAVLGGPKMIVVRYHLDPRAPDGPCKIVVDAHFGFDLGSAELDPAFNDLVGLGAYTLRRLPEVKLVITGFTDSSGSDVLNQRLSEQRAQAIVNLLVTNGISASRLVARGAGEADPIGDNGTPEGQALNRRVEVNVEGLLPFTPIGK
jgi:outer membrane protein OmpA-like peptidoglycan-associated protein